MKVLVSAMLGLALVAGTAAAFETPAQPQLNVTTLNGHSFKLSAQRGHWVVINFWATWCRPCIKEMPELSHFVKTHANVRAIGLAFDDSSSADIKAFIKAHPVDYPIAHLDVYHPPKDFGAPLGLPKTYLIAPDGRVAKVFVGPITATDLSKAMQPKTERTKSAALKKQH